MMKLETMTVKVSHNQIWRGPNEKKIEHKMAELGEEGWFLKKRSEHGFTRFDAHTRLTFQRYKN